MSADERRAAILVVAREEFAKSGFHGTSTERIAVRAGVSQPYLFRLFRTKKQLFLACVRAGFDEVIETFARAKGDLTGEDALQAMGKAYVELLQDRTSLQAQMQAYAAAADDPDLRTAVRQGFGDVVGYVEASTGVEPARVSRFMAKGMLLNVIAAMDLLDADEPWAVRLVDGCREDPV
jgi:AcrR family transcriptional regulator